MFILLRASELLLDAAVATGLAAAKKFTGPAATEKCYWLDSELQIIRIYWFNVEGGQWIEKSAKPTALTAVADVTVRGDEQFVVMATTDTVAAVASIVAVRKLNEHVCLSYLSRFVDWVRDPTPVRYFGYDRLDPEIVVVAAAVVVA